jgi:tetratricopeptide (TPR) repeat protein
VQADRAVSIVEAGVAANQQGAFTLPFLLRIRADIERLLGRFPEAERDTRRAIDLLARASEPGVRSAGIGNAYLTLGQTLQAEGRIDEARRAGASALEHLEPTIGLNHPITRQARALAKRTLAEPR